MHLALYSLFFVVRPKMLGIMAGVDQKELHSVFSSRSSTSLL